MPLPGFFIFSRAVATPLLFVVTLTLANSAYLLTLSNCSSSGCAMVFHAVFGAPLAST
jgi:hypothetical protein